MNLHTHPPPFRGYMAAALSEKMELAEKLKGYIVRSGKTQRQLADEVGMEESYLSKLTNGVTNWAASRKYFGPLAQALRLTQDEIHEINPLYSLESVPIHTMSGSIRNDVELLRYSMKNVFDLAQASRPLEEMEPLPEISPVLVANRDLRSGTELFLVRGDSMTISGERGILDGDMIYVDTHDTTPQLERVYVIHIPGSGVCLKRVRLIGGEMYLFSDNEDQGAYPPFKTDEARVIGRVHHVTRTPRVRL